MKKGFTLIELLGVIILLAVIAVIAYPLIDNVIKDSRERAYQQTINGILDAAKQYGTSNNLGYNSEIQVLPISTLVSDGYLKNDEIINPINNEVLTGCVLYSWNSSTYQFVYTFSEDCDTESPDIEPPVIEPPVIATPGECFTTTPYSVIESFTIDYDACVDYYKYMSTASLTNLCNGNEISSYPYNITKFNNEQLLELLDYNVIKDVVKIDGVAITDYDADCGADLVIPSKINDFSVLMIREYSFQSEGLKNVNFSLATDLVYIEQESFSSNSIEKVSFNNLSNLNTIGYRGFAHNKISSIDLSDLVSLETIERQAFESNNFSIVILPENLINIGRAAFYYNPLTTVVNKTGKSFDWGTIINGNYSSTSYIFETGTVSTEFGDVEITN